MRMLKKRYELTFDSTKYILYKLVQVSWLLSLYCKRAVKVYTGYKITKSSVCFKNSDFTSNDHSSCSINNCYAAGAVSDYSKAPIQNIVFPSTSYIILMCPLTVLEAYEPFYWERWCKLWQVDCKMQFTVEMYVNLKREFLTITRLLSPQIKGKSDLNSIISDGMLTWISTNDSDITKVYSSKASILACSRKDKILSVQE